MKILTIQDLSKVYRVKKGKYREEFEKVKVAKKDPVVVERLKNILAFKPVSGKVYSDNISYCNCGQRYCVVLRDVTVDEYGGAHGLTYKKGVYVVDLEKNKVIYAEGPYTYRGGHPNDVDAWKLAFDEARILEEDERGVVCGLKSRELLLIKHFSQGSSRIIEEYDLRKEKEEEEEKKQSLESAINGLEMTSLNTLLKTLCGRKTWITSKKLSEGIAFSMVEYYDRDYDAKVDLIEFFVTLKCKGIVKLGEWCPKSYHPPFKYHEVKGRIGNIEFQEEEGIVEIRVEVEVWQWDYSRVFLKDNRLQDKKEFKFEVNLREAE